MKVLTLICLCVGAVSTQNTTPEPKVVVPPVIVEGPPRILSYTVNRSFQIPCRATGDPPPTYHWKRNYEDFDPAPNDGRISVIPGVGTLIFSRPIKKDEAVYQCFATNTGGVAASDKVYLRMAYLGSFLTTSLITHRPSVGNSLTLTCRTPRSYPPAHVFWATVRQGASLIPVDSNDRVTVDEIGNLHFANVLLADSKGGDKYACVVMNKVVRSVQQGEYQAIQPQPGPVPTIPANIMWQSPTHQMALKGREWRIMCIFSGSPTPRVHWSRLGEKAMPGRARVEKYGKELIIDNIQMEDAGTYECQGINDAMQVPIRRSFTLKVEAVPEWEEEPASVTVAELETVAFNCNNYGIPEPSTKWFSNFIPFERSTSFQNGRFVIQNNTLTVTDTTKLDTQVLQCNASNKHGYAFSSFYLRVHSSPPTITRPPIVGYLVAVGQSFNLTCTVTGTPEPDVTWLKDEQEIKNPRFTIIDKGYLQIQSATVNDGGQYTCLARNKFGSMNMTGSVVVRGKTQVILWPTHINTEEGGDVQFHCKATTDPKEKHNIRIQWLRLNKRIDFTRNVRYTHSLRDGSLIIRGVIPRDTGKYTCRASNGIDQDEASALLTVMGVPDPPYRIRADLIEERRVRISWVDGNENNSPILWSIIQFNTSFNPFKWTDVDYKVKIRYGNQVELPLSWGNYSFRVRAQNSVGLSPPSDSSRMISTPPARPDKNPDLVIGEGNQPDNLIIYWKPLTQLERNGPDLYYVVKYRRKGNSQWRTARVAHTSSKYTVNNADGPYQEYEVSVSAGNSYGDARQQAKTVIGYTGEDVPIVTPIGIRVLKVEATEAVLSWPQFDTGVDNVRGFFRGYRVTSWNSRGTKRYQDIILHEPQRQYVPVRNKRDDTVSVKITKLWPYSNISLTVQVLNRYYVGPQSLVVFFTTPESTPGPPASLIVTDRGDNYIEIQWQSPKEPHGEIVGYKIEYQTVNNLELGRRYDSQPILDSQMTTNVTRLRAQQTYRLYLYALTAVGQGEPIFIQVSTTPPVMAALVSQEENNTTTTYTTPKSPSAPVFRIGNKNHGDNCKPHFMLLTLACCVYIYKYYL